MKTAELSPSLHHDLYATNEGFFAAWPVYRELRAEFDAAGLRLIDKQSVLDKSSFYR